MSMSVPGNSCRPCRSTSNSSGCLTRLAGECVYYSGSNISGPNINQGDTLNTLTVKIINYINSQIAFPPSIIPITSDDFESDGVTVSRSDLSGVQFEIFLNDLNRFVYNEVGNQEWDYVVGGGFKILLPGFDATTSDYHLYVFPKSSS